MNRNDNCFKFLNIEMSSESGQGANIISDLTELILIANAGNSSFVVQTDSTPALYVDSSAKVGVNTLTPTSQLEVVSNNGECIKVRRGKNGPTADLNVSTDGDLEINVNTSGRSIKTGATVDITTHDGNTAGLKLGGQLVAATAQQLNAVATPAGSAVAGKAMILDSSKNISGVNSISASQVTGTLQTAAQPNVTSVGTLESLSVTNGVIAGQLTGTMQTAAQPNITSVGTLNSLNVSNGVTAAQLTGTLQTAAQPNITSVGNLTSLTVAGVEIGVEASFLSGAVPGTATESQAVILDDAKSFSGIESLVANELTGTLQTAAQPNVTSVGTLNSLNVTNGVTATQLTGTLQTAAQPNITSVGALSSVSVAGSTISNEAAYLSGAVSGTAAANKVVVLNGSKSISGLGAVSANQLTGTLQTAAQPNITSIGGLSTVSIAGSTIASEAAFLSGVVAGTATANKVMVLNSSKTISGLTSLSATSLTGTLQTAAQPNVTSVGTLTSLQVSGATSLTSTNNSSNATSGALIVAGGIGVAKSIHVGESIYGEIATPVQPNIVSVGTLTYLDVSGNANIQGTLTLNGVLFGEGGGSGPSLPEYVTGIVAGTATNSKALVLNSSGSISGITSLGATSLSGTLQTAAQPNITSLGSLSGLTVGGNVAISGSLTVNGSNISGIPSSLNGITEGTASASKALIVDSLRSITNINSLTASQLTGTLQTAAQPNITSLGSLSGLSVSGNVAITGTLTVNGTSITSGGSSSDYLTGVTEGVASASKALVLDSSKNITGINKLSTTDLITSGSVQSVGGVNWVTRTAATSNAWQSICWSPELSLFAAVSISGSGNRVMTSPDGITWTSRTSAADTSWFSVCWSSELLLFVAAGWNSTDSRIMTSPDGITWTGRTTPNNVWTAVCWSPELSIFVAVAAGGTGNRAMTSPDGINWTSRSSAADNDWFSVCWSSELSLFVAVSYTGTGNRVMTSPDGINWTSRSSASNNNWVSVCWSPERLLFVAVSSTGSGNRVMTSSNGITWTTRLSASDTSWNSVCWATELSLFVAVASSGTGNRVMTSPDGINWTNRISAADYQWMSICWAPELSMFASVGSSGSGCMTSQHIATSSLTLVKNTAQTGITNSSSLGITAGSSLKYQGGLYGSHRWTQDTLTLTDNELMRLNKTGLGIGVAAPRKKLDIRSSTGKCLRLRYGTTASVDLDVTSSGVLSVNATIDALALSLGGSIVNLNTLSGVTAGTASASKALVLDASSNITGINSLSASQLTGTLQTASQPNITSLGTLSSLNVGGNVAITGTLTVNGTQITSGGGSGGTSDYLTGVTEGVASASKALVLDSSKNISGLGKVTTTDLVVSGSVQSYASLSWTSRTSGVDKGILGICWSPELQKFVAVAAGSGGTNTCLVSSNGTTWSSSILATNSGYWRSVCWSAELMKFVAVAFSSPSATVAVSSDGITWSNSSRPDNNTWYSVCWSPELSLFVATSGAGTNRAMRSSDGITWTPMSLPANNSWGSICWSPELSLFVAVAWDGTSRVVTSPDGINWTLRSAPTTSGWYSVCWSPELMKFVAVGYDGTNRTMSSSDGISWTNGDVISSGVWQQICWCAELSLFVAVANDTKIMISSNGTSWTIKDISGLTSQSCCWSPELSMIVAGGTNGNLLTSSHIANSSIQLVTNIAQAGITNTSSLGISADVHTKYQSGLNGSHRWLQDTPTLVNSELMRLNRIGLGLGVVTPRRKLDIQESQGKCLRLRYGTTARVDISVTSTGVLSVGGTINATALSIGGSVVDLSPLSGVTAGTAAASKALVLSSSRDLVNINSIASTTVTIGGVPLSTTEASYLTSIAIGTGSASKALILDASRNIININSITAQQVIFGGTQVFGTTQAAFLTGITTGTAAASKALILDGNRSITNINSLTLSSLIFGTTILTATEGAYLTSITAGTGAASKALVLDASRNITNINSLTTTTLVLGTTSLTSTQAAYLTSITAGTAVASKALILDASKTISGISSLSSDLINMTSNTPQLIMGSSFGDWTEISLRNGVSRFSITTSGSSFTQSPGAFSIDCFNASGGFLGNCISISTNRYLGIQTYSPRCPLDVDGGIARTISSGWSYSSIGSSSFSGSTPAITAMFTYGVQAETFYATSDRRLKCDVESLNKDFCKDFIFSTSPVQYKYKSNLNATHYGYIAQEVYKAGYSNLITITPHDDLEADVDEDGFRSAANEKMVLSYEGIVPILAQNIKTIYEENDKLKEEISDLKQQIQDILARLNN